LNAEDLEVQGEPSPTQTQQPFAHRQTEPFRKYSAEDEQPTENKPNEQGPENWDFLDTRKK